MGASGAACGARAGVSQRRRRELTRGDSSANRLARPTMETAQNWLRKSATSRAERFARGSMKEYGNARAASRWSPTNSNAVASLRDGERHASMSKLGESLAIVEVDLDFGKADWAEEATHIELRAITEMMHKGKVGLSSVCGQSSAEWHRLPLSFCKS